MAAEVAVELKKQGGTPGEFYVVVETTDVEHQLIIQLWHKDFFLPENAGVRGNVPGPTSHKGRNMYFDIDLRAVTKTVYWR